MKRKMQNANKAAIKSRQVVVNKIKTKKLCETTNDEILGRSAEMRSKTGKFQSPFRKDTRNFKLPELKVALHRDFYTDAIKISIDDLITEEYEQSGENDDFTNTRQKRKRTSKASKNDLNSSKTSAEKSSGKWQGAEKEATNKESDEAIKKSATIELEVEDEDDPNKLWCICREARNNRFMIMCDYCEEWFHGNCVGISKQKNRELEKLKQEWICLNCEKKGRGMPMKFTQNSL